MQWQRRRMRLWHKQRRCDVLVCVRKVDAGVVVARPKRSGTAHAGARARALRLRAPDSAERGAAWRR
eukprot:246705-Chlamydomonas_euryale.AAC.3